MSDTAEPKGPDKPWRAVKRPGDPNRRRGRIARPGTSKRGPLAVKIRLRQREVLQLRRKGLAYETIAKQIGISDSQVERDVTNALAAAIHEPAHAVFKMEMQRLDEMFASRYDAALQGDDNAYYACLAVMKHRDQLLGWIGAGREIAARLTLGNGQDGPESGRKLDISFHLPTSNGGRHTVAFDDLPNMGRPQLEPPSPTRIRPQPDDVTIEKASGLPAKVAKLTGSYTAEPEPDLRPRQPIMGGKAPGRGWDWS
jgi:DNA-binding CsgD family transcriptional regulator